MGLLIDTYKRIKEQNDSIEKVIDYVIDFEENDFKENPSDNHVFYHAVVFSQGKAYADKLLEEAKEAQNAW